MICHLGGRLAGEQDAEFFSSAAVRLAAARDPRQPGCDQTQNLVSSVMAVGVVELLEVIDIDDGNRIRSLQTQQGVIERAA